MPAEPHYQSENSVLVPIEDGVLYVEYRHNTLAVVDEAFQPIYVTTLVFDSLREKTLQQFCLSLQSCLDPRNPIELVYAYGGSTAAFQPVALPKGSLC
jgi:hypothetical protein